MKNGDLLGEISLALLANKARSGLTILGIIIGISSVIAMVSIGQGATGSVQSRIESLGSNLLTIRPGAQRVQGYQASSGRGQAQSLTLADIAAISSEISSVKSTAGEVSERYQITAKGTNTNTQVTGTTASYLDIKNLAITDGVFISDQDSTNLSKVAVLGPTTRDDLFGADNDALGQTIRIKGMEFKIIGVTAAKGGTGFGSQDDMIYVPLATAQRFLSGNQYINTIDVQVVDQNSMALAQEEVTSLLLQRHNISDPTAADFNILNQADILSSASSITQTLTLLLAAIAGISLVVGGIGIMNMMLTTVTERTREIGLRKAIGAKASDINKQFLMEAMALTFIGGIIGIIIGWLVALAVTKFSGIATQVSGISILLACGVSAAIGIIFGYYPAKRAAKLNPIEALRYE